MTSARGPDRTQRPRGAHLVGSVPLAGNEAVFREVWGRLGTHLRRLPDGETGARTNWIQWQFPLLRTVPGFESSEEPERFSVPALQLADGVSMDDVALPDLGYRDAAIESYEVFARLKQADLIRPGVRFQVCLPTPLAVIRVAFALRDQQAVEVGYERKLLEELDGIFDAVPPHELAVQWDTAVEFSILEGLSESFMEDPEHEILERLVRLGDHVPADVDMGYHLCYGDAGHRHFIEPADTSKLVAVANGVSMGVGRSIHWLHMPVPRDRADAAYFAPLHDLRLQPETEFYLGLVHMTDGLEGARARIAVAQDVVTDFGVATECGFGRRDPATVPALLDIHAQLADPL